MGRRLEIDAIRGLMLVWMVATHLPTFLPTYTNQPFGFVSASEGFIFLSALFLSVAQAAQFDLQRTMGVRRRSHRDWFTIDQLPGPDRHVLGIPG